MMNKTVPELELQSLMAAGRHRIPRPLLSPEVSELLNMLEAFEKSLAPDVAA